ncbi:endonuclease/exonuclease/phosphatase family protein [Paenibacillus guangzhouensis]|uniref:endonuclease/exonuclease/phosphatase family protein n=1 Tax=Paenibacillus guangzhouensis TaxID=1473112 RepID=UPI00187BB45A|nr:endonuclease/exonuclease/phosphatase family protein [Paenibacillus guangzhouensis]
MNRKEQSSVRLRVLTYNIHHGEGMDGVVDLERIAKVMKSLQPDIIALQEVDKCVPRSDDVDQTAELARLMGMTGVFGHAIDLMDGEYGVAILTRFTIISAQKTNLPNMEHGEQRIVLTAKLDVGSHVPPVTFSAAHLEWNPKEIQAAQAEVILKLHGQDSPYILAGDLNAVPSSDTMKRLTEAWTDATANITDWTNPEDGKIDYIMVGTKNQWHVEEAFLLREDVASDHRPVLAVLTWRG